LGVESGRKKKTGQNRRDDAAEMFWALLLFRVWLAPGRHLTPASALVLVPPRRQLESSRRQRRGDVVRLRDALSAREYLEQHGRSLKFCSEALRRDKATVLRAISQSADAFEFAHESLRGDREFLLESAAVGAAPSVLRHADARIRADPEVVLAFVSRDGRAMEFAEPRLKNDPSFVSRAFRKAKVYPASVFEFAGDAPRRDRGVMLEAVTRTGEVLGLCLDDALTRDREIVRAAVRSNASALSHADASLKCDADFILNATSNNLKACVTHGGLRADEAFMTRALRREPAHTLAHADESLRNDATFMRRAYDVDPSLFRYAGPSLSADPDFMLALGKDHPPVLALAHESLSRNRDYLLKAIEIDPAVLEWTRTHLVGNRKFMLDAVKRVPAARNFASAYVRNDWLIVRTALWHQARRTLDYLALALPTFLTRKAATIARPLFRKLNLLWGGGRRPNEPVDRVDRRPTADSGGGGASAD